MPASFVERAVVVKGKHNTDFSSCEAVTLWKESSRQCHLIRVPLALYEDASKRLSKYLNKETGTRNAFNEHAASSW